MSCLKEPTGNTTAAASLNASSGLWQEPSTARTRDAQSVLVSLWSSPPPPPLTLTLTAFFTNYWRASGLEMPQWTLSHSFWWFKEELLKCSKQGHECLVGGPSAWWWAWRVQNWGVAWGSPAWGILRTEGSVQLPSRSRRWPVTLCQHADHPGKGHANL